MKSLKGWVWSLLLLVASAGWAVEPVSDFAALGQQAKQANTPVILYFYRERCGPCQRFEENALDPLLAHELLEGFALVAGISANGKEPVVDFDGQKVDPAELAALYNVTTFPKLVFVDYQGNPLEIRMENSGAYDYFPYYFKQRINEALAKLHNPKRIEKQF